MHQELTLKDMVRQQLQEFGDASVDEAIDWINRKYGIDANRATYNQYRSAVRNEDGKEPAKRGRKPGTTNRVTSDEISLEDVIKAKDLLRKSGLESPLETLHEMRPLVDDFGGDFNRLMRAVEKLDELRADETPEPVVSPSKGRKGHPVNN